MFAVLWMNKGFMKLFTLLFFFTLIACSSPEKALICGSPLLSKEDAINSKILKYKTSQNTDTSLALIEGRVFGKKIGNKHSEIIKYANISIFISDSLINGTTSNNEGFYSLHIPNGNYNIKYSFLGFNELIIDSVQLKANEIIEFEIQLGEGHYENQYYMINNIIKNRR